jgi:MFS family permease
VCFGGESVALQLGGTFFCSKVVIQNRGMLVVGRIISGISVGLSSAIVPIYQSEITAPAIRGRIVSLQQWSITWGILIQYFIQFGCSYIDGVASFRIPWGLQMIPAIVLALGMTVFPESPRWLIDKNRFVLCLFQFFIIQTDYELTGSPKPYRFWLISTAKATSRMTLSYLNSRKLSTRFTSNARKVPSHIWIC